MRARSSLLVLLLIAVSCSAETLKELLVANHIPPALLGQPDLGEAVQGIGKSNKDQVVVAYLPLDGALLVGSPRLLRYDKVSRTVVRADFHMQETDVCSGSLLDIYFIGEFTVLSTHVSPSAECLLVFGKDLELSQTLYGFGPVEVVPDLVVITESMIHFAPVHPERLQLADLRKGTTSELYPPKDDELREQLMTEHEKHMPPPETCARMNDPCEPDKFDEDIRSLATDGKGRFAFIANQTANHATEEGQPGETVADQTVLYVYAQVQGSWLYCEEEIDDSEVDSLDKALKLGLDKVVARCTPNLPVVQDMSTADYNPFLKR